MNKHMKTHSQRLNIKMTQLASLTAVFHSKKQRPPVADNPHLSMMDIDEEGSDPGHQAGGSEAIPTRPASRFDGNETNDGDSGDDDNALSEGPLADSDSGDEFESDDENLGDRRNGAEKGQGPLEFELRAAEAGSVQSLLSARSRQKLIK